MLTIFHVGTKLLVWLLLIKNVHLGNFKCSNFNILICFTNFFVVSRSFIYLKFCKSKWRWINVVMVSLAVIINKAIIMSVAIIMHSFPRIAQSRNSKLSLHNYDNSDLIWWLVDLCKPYLLIKPGFVITKWRKNPIKVTLSAERYALLRVCRRVWVCFWRCGWSQM